MNLRFTLLLVCAFLCTANPLSAQKAKFKNLKATCQKTQLPSNYVAPEDRTYDLYLKGSYSGGVEAYNKGIYGWTLDNESPKMEAVVSLYGFTVNPVKRTSEKKEKKDKEGKVVDKWTEYTYKGSAVGKGTLYVYGPKNPFVYQKKDDEKSKSELAREAKAAEAEAAKKKELAANPFLSADDVADVEDDSESDVGEDAGLDNAVLPLVETVNLDVSKSVATPANRSLTKAYENYRNTQRPKLYNLKGTYPNASYNRALKTLNAKYGYSPATYTVWMKKMKSDKHPEFEMWNNACTAAQTLFKPFRYNQPIDEAQKKFEPIVAYFKSKVASIDDKDRKGKNMKKAAFENTINILYHLDKYDDVLAYCNEYKDSKHLDRDAKRMIKKANRQKDLMAFHKLETCHVENVSYSGEEEIETEAEGDEPAPETDEDGKQ